MYFNKYIISFNRLHSKFHYDDSGFIILRNTAAAATIEYSVAVLRFYSLTLTVLYNKHSTRVNASVLKADQIRLKNIH